MTVAPDIHLGDGEHAVEFYSRDEDLVAVLVGHLAPALRGGEAAIVIATQTHIDAFTDGLIADGVDVAAALADRQLVMLDAATTLKQFFVDGLVDPDLFDATLRGPIQALGAHGRQVRAYGEMVTLLWESGDVPGAIELERLWNELQHREPSFSLLCSYPAHLISAPETAVAFSEMCDLHRRVLSGAPIPPGHDVSRRFSRNAAGPRLARHFVTETLMAWERPDLLSDCLLVVSELATNAVRHAGSDFTVSLSKWNDGVTVMVGDASSQPPVHRDHDSEAPGGRGLHLVSENSTHWGHFPAGVGKLVWATVAPAESKVG